MRAIYLRNKVHREQQSPVVILIKLSYRLDIFFFFRFFKAIIGGDGTQAPSFANINTKHKLIQIPFCFHSHFRYDFSWLAKDKWILQHCYDDTDAKALATLVGCRVPIVFLCFVFFLLLRFECFFILPRAINWCCSKSSTRLVNEDETIRNIRQIYVTGTHTASGKNIFS